MKTNLNLRMVNTSKDQLTWFEVELAPNEYRFGVVPGQPILFSPPASQRNPDGGLIVFRPDSPARQERYDEILRSLGILLNRYQLVETPMHEPNRVFDKNFAQQPSLHVRVAFASGRRWATWYPKQEISEKLKAFVQETIDVGFANLPKGKVLSSEEALSLFHKPSEKKKPEE